LDEGAELFNRIAKQLAALLPLPKGIADYLARRCVFAGRDRFIDRFCKLRRERDAALVDMSHDDLLELGW